MKIKKCQIGKNCRLSFSDGKVGYGKLTEYKNKIVTVSELSISGNYSHDNGQYVARYEVIDNPIIEVY